LDRNEVGAVLVAAGLGSAIEHALISVLALNGLRVSEATGANIEALGVEGGHRTPLIRRKGGKIVTIPLAPRTARAIDLAFGERTEGAIFIGADGSRPIVMAPLALCVASPGGPAWPSRFGPHTLRHTFITAALDAHVPCGTCKKPPHTPIPGRRCATTAPGSARPARHLHRLDLHRRRQPVEARTGAWAPSPS
jgi:integrase